MQISWNFVYIYGCNKNIPGIMKKYRWNNDGFRAEL